MIETDDELIDRALRRELQYHQDRVRKNPFGPWADDSREDVRRIEGLLQRRDRARRRAA